MLSSALTAGVGLATLIIHRIKCAYRRNDEGECLPSCACQEKPLEEESELTVHRVTLNGLELIYAARKAHQATPYSPSSGAASRT